MSKQQKCPQCGTQLYNEYYTSVVCPMCGWGKEGNATLTPSSGLAYRLSSKSPRWKFGVIASAVILLLLVTPLIKFSRNQIVANQAVAKARMQMEKRLYASAARTLNEAPRASTTSDTKNQLNSLLSDTVRWAHNISDAGSAKASILEGNSQDALDNLDEIDEDFPEFDESEDLVDVAQEMEIDDDFEVSEDELDDIFEIPDDPEMDNLDDIEESANEQIDNEDSPDKPETTDAATTPSSSDEDEPDDSEATAEGGDDPTESAESDLPEAPSTTNNTPVANKQPRLVTFYQILWQKQDDRDNFYTIDVNNEVTPGKDKKSGFSGYEKNGAIGQVYTRKLPNNPSVIPLYRYWSAKDTNHFYTTSSKFAGKNTNYVKQQVAAYIGKWDGQKCLAGSKPLYTVYSKKVTNNIYTSSLDVKNQLASAGYNNPKVIGCVW